MAYNIGLNIVEVDGLGSPALVGASTSVAAFNIATLRGAPNSPLAVTSFAQFVDRFGSYTPNGLGAYLVRGFFDNGGQTAYINRIVSSDATNGAKPASLTLKDTNSTPNNILLLEAGYRGAEDPGSWGNTLFVNVPAQPDVHVLEVAPATITSAVLDPAIDMTGLPPLVMNINGQATSLAFKASDFTTLTGATAAQIQDAINRQTQTTNLKASISSDNKLVLTAVKPQNDFSHLEVTAANAKLGFPAAVAPVAGTPADRTTTGTKLADLSSFAIGDPIRLTDGTTTAFTQVVALKPLSNDVTWQPVANIASFDAFKLRVSRATFDLTVALGVNDADHIVDQWSRLSTDRAATNYAVRVLNDPTFGSKYLVAKDLRVSGSTGLVVMGTTSSALTNGQGADPSVPDFTGDPAKHSGFYAFDPFDVQLLTCERNDAAIVTAALGYCAGRGDCMYIGAVPQGTVAAGQAIGYGQQFQGSKVYGALYGPWIVISDPAGVGSNPLKTVPPVGHVMGVYARIANNRGIWKAPAGDEASIVGALDVEYRLSDVDHTALVKQGSVNGIRAVARSGVIVDASRTLSTDTRWLYVNVRLLFNYVKSSLKDGLRWVRQEPNRNTLWDAVRIQTVTPFLMGLWRQGAFGTGTAAQVFTVICDASNNPPDQVDQGNLKVEIYFYPSKPAETIVIVVGQQPSGASASES